MPVGLPFPKDPEAVIKQFAKKPNSKVWSFFYFLKEKFCYFWIKKETYKMAESIF